MTIADAQTALERLLTREWANKGAASMERFARLLEEHQCPTFVRECFMDHELFVSKNAREIITAGSKQLVLQLGEGWVAKTAPVAQTARHYIINAHSNYSPACSETNNALRALGIEELGILLPEHQYLSMTRTGSNIHAAEHPQPGFVITPDLSEGGKYVLLELTERNLMQIENYDDLKHTSDEAIRRLYETARGMSDKYKLHIMSHGTQEQPAEAIEHLFFIRRDQKGYGTLVAGDQDHLAFTRKTQKPQYDRTSPLQTLDTAVRDSQEKPQPKDRPTVI